MLGLRAGNFEKKEVQKKLDLITVFEILGHSSILTTMRYAHPTPENKRKAVNVLAEIVDQDFREKNDIQMQDILHFSDNVNS